VAKSRKRSTKRKLFRELMSGVEAMRKHRQRRLALRSHQVEPLPCRRPCAPLSPFPTSFASHCP